MGKRLYEQIDVRTKASKRIKIWKHRAERRAARVNPDCVSHYRRYRGWVS